VTSLSTRRAVGHRSWHWVGAAIALAGHAAWEGFQAWPTPAAHWGVGVVIATSVGLVIAAGVDRQASSTRAWLSTLGASVRGWLRRPTGYGLAILVWIAFLSAICVWDLIGLLSASPNFPTFSRLVGDLTKYPIGRMLVFALWLIMGGYLILAGRRPASQVRGVQPIADKQGLR
jgi:hypothetical protein